MFLCYLICTFETIIKHSFKKWKIWKSFKICKTQVFVWEFIGGLSLTGIQRDTCRVWRVNWAQIQSWKQHRLSHHLLKGKSKDSCMHACTHTHKAHACPTHTLVSLGWHTKWHRVSSSNLSPSLFHLLCHSWFLFLLFLFCFLALSLTLLCKYCLHLLSFLCTNMGMNFSISSHGNSGTVSWVIHTLNML